MNARLRIEKYTGPSLQEKPKNIGSHTVVSAWYGKQPITSRIEKEVVVGTSSTER